MIYIAAFLTVICFVTAFKKFGIPAVAVKVLETGRNAARVIGDAKLSDRDKEQRLRKASFQLLGGFFAMLGRTVAALAVSVLPLLALDAAGLVRLSAVNDLLVSWHGILLTTAATTLAYILWGRQ